MQSERECRRTGNRGKPETGTGQWNRGRPGTGASRRQGQGNGNRGGPGMQADREPGQAGDRDRAMGTGVNRNWGGPDFGAKQEKHGFTAPRCGRSGCGPGVPGSRFTAPRCGRSGCGPGVPSSRFPALRYTASRYRSGVRTPPPRTGYPPGGGQRWPDPG